MRLATMEASEMLDVIHFLFEEDTTFISGEQVAYRDAFRKNIYKQFYNSDYKYSVSSDSSTGLDSLDGPLELEDTPIQEEKIKVFSPREKTAKPYIPPTQVSTDDIKPFGSVLDAPIN